MKHQALKITFLHKCINSVSSIKQYLNAPFAYTHEKWMIAIIPPLCVFLTTAVLKPFGLNFLEQGLRIALIVTFITAIFSCIVAYLFPLIFRKYYCPDSWTRLRLVSIGAYIVVLTMPFITYYSHIINIQIGYESEYTHLERIFISFTIGLFNAIFPTTLIYLLSKKKSEIMSKQKLCIENGNKQYDINGEEVITFASSTKDSLTILSKDFIYAEANKNYTLIFYIQNEKLVSKSVRTTISQIENTLESYPHIIRCHRAFITNTLQIADVEGNLHGYRLSMNHVAHIIPVSKTYTKHLKKTLNF